MSHPAGSNPFLALFGQPTSEPLSQPQIPKPEQAIEPQSAPVPTENDQLSKLNNLAEGVFRLTLRSEASSRNHHLHYMADLANALKPQNLFDGATLEQALFEYCVGLEGDIVLNYLFQCYERLENSLTPQNEEDMKNFTKLIFTNFQISLAQPELFVDHDICEQVVRLLAEQASGTKIRPFLNGLVQFCLNGEETTDAAGLFVGVFERLRRKFEPTPHLLLWNSEPLETLLVLSAIPTLAEAMLTSSILPAGALGRDCEKTLLGAVLAISCVPRGPAFPSDFFDRPSQTPASVHGTTEANCWTALERLITKVHQIVYALLKCSPKCNGLTRRWLGQALELNQARGQTWAQHHSGLLKANCVSDGFMLNLEAVLLKLCQPFCSANDPKAVDRLSKIDATFCATPVEHVGDDQGVHINGLHKETCLVSVAEDEKRPCHGPFTFLTELFYLTHRAVELGSKVVHAQLVETTQELNRTQRAYVNAEQSGQRQAAEEIQRAMDRQMTFYLSCKAALLVPQWIEQRLHLTLATCRWLCAVAPPLLGCVPEFCLSNVLDFVVFLNRFSGTTLETAGADQLQQYLTLVVVFMGSPQRLKNPHLRAAMAEMLDALVPHEERQQQQLQGSNFQRQQLFRQCGQSKELVAALLHVFASIEMTGQGVAFEQKFNYRRPMYAVLKFLWSLPTYRQHLKALASEAEATMEAATPPLFLQFCNLLINDAIYLLDEGLSHMSKLREQSEQRTESGGWPDVPPAQRSQREASFQHMGMLARFHNLMGRETIQVLEMMTRHIKSVFVHPTMVDRVASMLNYFLLHLVGPKKRDFKVKDFREKYEFDPAELVSSICQTYCHLSSVESFCRAVSQDGRSYSPQLFGLAEDVLSRIGKGVLIGDLQEVARRVAQSASSQASDEDLIASAPDEFLDPIMSTIMVNPVILPSSKVTVDRSTIARHLLSDQSDPFNRSPLTMEEVVADDALRERVQKWLEEQKKQ